MPPLQPALAPELSMMEAIIEPPQILERTGNDRQCDEFGHVVTMQPFDFGLEGGQPRGGSLDQQKELAGLFDFALPPIHGLHGRLNEIRAAG